MVTDLSLVILVSEDKILFNKDFSKFSLIPLEGFRTWSQLLDTDFKGYQLDD
jgi:hypothetical protein